MAVTAANSSPLLTLWALRILRVIRCGALSAHFRFAALWRDRLALQPVFGRVWRAGYRHDCGLRSPLSDGFGITAKRAARRPRWQRRRYYRGRRGALVGAGRGLAFDGIFLRRHPISHRRGLRPRRADGRATALFRHRLAPKTAIFATPYTLAILAGLVPVVHLSGVFFLPFLYFLAVYKRGLRAPQFVTAGAFFACALLPILYLPIRSAQFPAPPKTPMESSFYWPLDWSHPATLSGLKQHVTAAQYRRLLLETSTQIVGGKPVTIKKMAQPPAQIPARLRELGTFVLLGYLWATPLLLVGLWRSFALDKRVGWVLSLIFLSNLVTQINYKVSDQSNFFFPCYLIMALWMGLGLSVFLGVFVAARRAGARRRALVSFGDRRRAVGAFRAARLAARRHAHPRRRVATSAGRASASAPERGAPRRFCSIRTTHCGVFGMPNTLCKPRPMS